MLIMQLSIRSSEEYNQKVAVLYPVNTGFVWVYIIAGNLIYTFIYLL